MHLNHFPIVNAELSNVSGYAGKCIFKKLSVLITNVVGGKIGNADSVD